MTTQSLTPNTILGNISLSDSSETGATQSSPEDVGVDARGNDEPRDVIIVGSGPAGYLSLIHISEPTRPAA